MKLELPENLRTEEYPFRQVAVTSYIKGGLSILLGVIILLTIRPDFQAGHSILAVEKLAAAIGFLALGGSSMWRAYKDEYEFSIRDLFDTSQKAYPGKLLGQRSNNNEDLAYYYSDILNTETFKPHASEKGEANPFQLMFYKIASSKGLDKLFEFLPFPITNFITNQSSPVSMLGTFILLLIVFLFLAYLGITIISMIWLNLLVLVGLLSWFQPVPADSLVNRHFKDNIQKKIAFLVIFYIITVLVYKPSAEGINLGILLTILAVAGIMIYTAIVSFRLIEKVFSSRSKVMVSVSHSPIAGRRVSTQPNNILLQFDNTMKQTKGWFFKGQTKDARNSILGDQNRKGNFFYEYVYETHPTLESTTYDAESEAQLRKVWKIGTLILCAGLILIFIGVLFIPAIDVVLNSSDILGDLSKNAPGLLLSMYFVLLGLAIFFFGSKLVYEVYFFFNMEIFFVSDLVLFKAEGHFDEYEHEEGNIKRKDTFTDFTPEVIVCNVRSSVFVHPYMSKEEFSRAARYIINTSSNESLYNLIDRQFASNLGVYFMNQNPDLNYKEIPKNGVNPALPE